VRYIVDYLPGTALCAFVTAAAASAAFMLARKPPAKKLAFFFAATFFSAVYVFAACRILFNVTRYGIYGNTSPYYGNYVPFKTITDYIRRGHIGIFVIQIVGNIFVTLPLPFVVWAYSRRRNMKRVCLVSLLLTAAIEPVQLLINLFLGGPSNIIDVDDFILNLFGCALGLLLLKAVSRGRNRRL
jgi:glycopeptide antibiotics resistance protein